MKAQRLLRLMHTGEVYSGRTVLKLPMDHATFKAVVAPRNLYYEVLTVKGVQWDRGAAEILIKIYPGEPGVDYETARELAAQLRAIRRAGVSLRGLRVKPYRHRERKGSLDGQRALALARARARAAR